MVKSYWFSSFDTFFYDIWGEFLNRELLEVFLQFLHDGGDDLVVLPHFECLGDGIVPVRILNNLCDVSSQLLNDLVDVRDVFSKLNDLIQDANSVRINRQFFHVFNQRINRLLEHLSLQGLQNWSQDVVSLRVEGQVDHLRLYGIKYDFPFIFSVDHLHESLHRVGANLIAGHLHKIRGKIFQNF